MTDFRPEGRSIVKSRNKSNPVIKHRHLKLVNANMDFRVRGNVLLDPRLPWEIQLMMRENLSTSAKVDFEQT